MKLIPPSLETYFKSTRRLLYSYLVSLPLLLLYEALIYLTQPDPEHVVRISVDVWIKSLFTQVGYNALSITLLVVALLGIVIFYVERKRSYTLKLRYFLGMIGEAAIYAVLLALIISNTVAGLLQLLPAEPVASISALQKIALSLGAGLYEELFFRVILVSLLVWLFNFFFQRQWASNLAAVVLAAFLFSLAHYTGSLGDAFTMGSFLFRFLFGLALNGIYVLRGFGMAAWTHALYDIMLVAYLS